MFLGVTSDAANNYSLSNSELNIINSSNTAQLILGDKISSTQDICKIFIHSTINFYSTITNNLYISSLYPSAQNTEIIFFNQSSVNFNLMHVSITSYSNIRFLTSSNIALHGSG